MAAKFPERPLAMGMSRYLHQRLTAAKPVEDVPAEDVCIG